MSPTHEKKPNIDSEKALKSSVLIKFFKETRLLKSNKLKLFQFTASKNTSSKFFACKT